MDYRKFCKSLQVCGLISSLVLSACSVNPATGRNQFTGLMPAESEAQVGASQHEEIVKQYGGLYKDQKLQNYVSSVGSKVARNTERTDVTYQFFVLDSPVVNAFALPGGYVYVTRGLLAVANDEAELAGVLGHEIGHVTGRHSAARYSQSVVTGLGTTLLGAYLGNSAVSQMLDVGSNLYISSYSREQETEADTLGIRYLDRSGYDPKAVSDFLAAMDQYQVSQSGKAEKAETPNFFSTHPQTAGRVAAASADAARYPGNAKERGAGAYLAAIDGMTYGDSPEQGFVRGTNFYHPVMGFTFSVPQGYKIKNSPEQIVASKSGGALIVVDQVKANTADPASYIMYDWLQGKRQLTPEKVNINGHDAATASFDTTLNGAPITLRLVAINWGNGSVFRMQFAIPKTLPSSEIEALKATTYSLRNLSANEISGLKTEKIRVVDGAQIGQTTALIRALNNLKTNENVVAGRKYKIVVE